MDRDLKDFLRQKEEEALPSGIVTLTYKTMKERGYDRTLDEKTNEPE